MILTFDYDHPDGRGRMTARLYNVTRLSWLDEVAIVWMHGMPAIYCNTGRITITPQEADVAKWTKARTRKLSCTH